ncbi:MAG TPA: hypothetical protein VMB50_15685 [Myxococcales bacterium]|nr:hypothetical protein [Myxococcales bacterium]
MKKHLLACVALSAFAVACSGGNGGTTGGNGGSTGGGNSGGTSSGGSTGGATADCEGFGLDAGGTQLFADTYAFGFVLKSDNCQATITGWKDGQSTNLTGIFDEDLDGNNDGQPTAGLAAPYAIFLTDCDDVGLGAGSIDGDGGMNFAPPAADAGAVSVASIVGGSSPSTTAGAYSFWGVVTAVNAWYYSTTDSEWKGGTVYVQDIPTSGTPAPNSGVSIYVEGCTSKGCTDSVLSNSSPTAPQRGDVVLFSGMTWSPYNGYFSGFSGYSNSQHQFSAAKGLWNMSILGTAPLPTPVQLTPAQAAYNTTNATALGYQGMRATVTGGPFTVEGDAASNDCPNLLEYAGG